MGARESGLGYQVEDDNDLYSVNLENTGRGSRSLEVSMDDKNVLEDDSGHVRTFKPPAGNELEDDSGHHYKSFMINLSSGLIHLWYIPSPSFDNKCTNRCNGLACKTL